MSLSCTIFEIERVICRNRIFRTPREFGAPIRAVPLEFHEDDWRQKTGVHELPCGVVYLYDDTLSRFDKTLAS